MEGKCDQRINNTNAEFKSLLQNVENELIWIHVEWEIYKELFGHSQERTDIINRASGLVAFIIEDNLLRNIIMGICRLADPPKTRSHENLSVKYITGALQAEYVLTKPQKEEIKVLETNLDEKLKALKTVRNKAIGHNDLARYADSGSQVLNYPSRSAVSDAIESLDNLLQAVCGMAGIKLKAYTPIICGDPAKRFLFALDLGNAAAETSDFKAWADIHLQNDCAVD